MDVPRYVDPNDLPEREPNPLDTDELVVELVFLDVEELALARATIEAYYEWPVDRIERSREIRDAIEYVETTGRPIGARDPGKVGQPVEEGLLGYLVWIPRATIENVYRYTMF